MPNGSTDRAAYTPRYPTLIALLCTSAWVVVLCAPMFAGRFLVGVHSDQYVAGYGFRQFYTEYARAHGAIPLWNPYLFGGLPYVAAMHGDIFYPTAWLRVVLPTDIAMNIGFFAHLIFAGFFTYCFLRALRLPWLAAVAGGISYQLGGQVASLVHPGHDGKLYVSALLPLALWALVKGIRDGKWQGFGLLGICVGLAVLSPSYQMAYYLLLAAGMFALYLAFLDPDRPTGRAAWVRLAAALAAVLAGGAVAAVQVLPFLQYLPFSPRAAAGASTGWEYATSWSMPPEELLNTLLPQFSGLGPDHYWGRNFFKLHTEYLGVGSLILATLGLARPSRPRLRWAFVAIAGVFLIVSLGGHTPFYRVFYELLPFIKKTRAPSMAFYLVAFAVAVWAALGVERVLSGEGKLRALAGWLVALGAVLLFAVAGIFTNLGRSIAEPQQVQTLLANQGTVVWGAVRIAVFGAAMAGLLFAWRSRKVTAQPFAVALLMLLGLDLWTIDRQFFVFSPRARVLYAPDEVTERIMQSPRPYRVLDLPPPNGVYPGATLMAYDIPQVLGYHGFEIRFYDDLLGGKNAWRHLASPQLWKLLAVRFIVLPDTVGIPGYHPVLGPVPTTLGSRAYLYEADTVPPYARVVPAAVKGEADQIIATILDPRLDFNRVVLFAPEESVNPSPVTAMPAPSPSQATVTAWEPGRMSIALDPTPPAPSYVTVAENWYPDWRATVDGLPAPVLRGDQALITVPVPAGARRIDLVFASAAYARGRLISLAAVLVLAGVSLAPTVAGWRRRG